MIVLCTPLTELGSRNAKPGMSNANPFRHKEFFTLTSWTIHHSSEWHIGNPGTSKCNIIHLAMDLFLILLVTWT
jgi:hypothetical protein